MWRAFRPVLFVAILAFSGQVQAQTGPIPPQPTPLGEDPRQPPPAIPDAEMEDAVVSGQIGDPSLEASRTISSRRVYQGIIPGKRDVLSGFERFQKAKLPYLTWIGFQHSSKSARVFLQTSQEAQYSVQPGEEKQVVILLHGARLAWNNNTRPLNTLNFGSPVKRVYAKRVREGVKVVILLREPAAYQVFAQGGYLFLDFPSRAVTPLPPEPERRGEEETSY